MPSSPSGCSRCGPSPGSCTSSAPPSAICPAPTSSTAAATTPSSEATARAVAGTGSADVCDHCGCRGVDAIRELMDEHTALIDQSYGVRQAFRADDSSEAMTLLTALVLRLERHVHREEDGIFR